MAVTNNQIMNFLLKLQAQISDLDKRVKNVQAPNVDISGVVNVVTDMRSNILDVGQEIDKMKLVLSSFIPTIGKLLNEIKNKVSDNKVDLATPFREQNRVIEHIVGTLEDTQSQNSAIAKSLQVFIPAMAKGIEALKNDISLVNIAVLKKDDKSKQGKLLNQIQKDAFELSSRIATIVDTIEQAFNRSNEITISKVKDLKSDIKRLEGLVTAKRDENQQERKELKAQISKSISFKLPNFHQGESVDLSIDFDEDLDKDKIELSIMDSTTFKIFNFAAITDKNIANFNLEGSVTKLMRDAPHTYSIIRGNMDKVKVVKTGKFNILTGNFN